MARPHLILPPCPVRPHRRGGGQVGGESVDVVLVGVEVDQATVDADPHVDGYAELPLGLLTELCYGAGDVQSSPAATARCTSFSCAFGCPNTANNPSPLIELIWPSYRSTTRRTSSR